MQITFAVELSVSVTVIIESAVRLLMVVAVILSKVASPAWKSAYPLITTLSEGSSEVHAMIHSLADSSHTLTTYPQSCSSKTLVASGLVV